MNQHQSNHRENNLPSVPVRAGDDFCQGPYQAVEWQEYEQCLVHLFCLAECDVIQKLEQPNRLLEQMVRPTRHRAVFQHTNARCKATSKSYQRVKIYDPFPLHREANHKHHARVCKCWKVKPLVCSKRYKLNNLPKGEQQDYLQRRFLCYLAKCVFFHIHELKIIIKHSMAKILFLCTV